MLRGNLNGAREKFHQALLQDPDDQTIQNNIALLNGSYRFIQRILISIIYVFEFNSLHVVGQYRYMSDH